MVREYVQGSDFDSRLNYLQATPHTNADFYIVARVYLYRHEPAGGSGTFRDGNGADIPVSLWPSLGIWRQFRQTFKEQIERRFDNQLWLVPNGSWGYDVPVQSPSHRANVRCNIRIDLQDTPDNPHLSVTCVYTRAGSGFRASMGRQQGRVSYSSAYENDNVCGLSQVALPHEFGHFLGLDHVGRSAPGCTTNREPVCYCPSSAQASDMMGAGNDVNVWHARPWLNRIARHLTVSPSWSAVRVRPAPRPLSSPVSQQSAGARRMSAGHA